MKTKMEVRSYRILKWLKEQNMIYQIKMFEY